MCGICGVFHTDPDRPVDGGLLEGMNETLRHRGPDSAGYHVDSSSGGAQVVIQNLLHALKDDFSFTLAVLGSTGRFSAAYEALGTPVFELGNQGSRWSPFSLRRLVGTICGGRYELIHTYLFKPSILWSNLLLVVRISTAPAGCPGSPQLAAERRRTEREPS